MKSDDNTIYQNVAFMRSNLNSNFEVMLSFVIFILCGRLSSSCLASQMGMAISRQGKVRLKFVLKFELLIMTPICPPVNLELEGRPVFDGGPGGPASSNSREVSEGFAKDRYLTPYKVN
jgi:hypothetical protein